MKLPFEVVKPEPPLQPKCMGEWITVGFRVDLDVRRGKPGRVGRRLFSRRLQRHDPTGEEPSKHSLHHLGSDTFTAEASIAYDQGELGRTPLRYKEDIDVTRVLAGNLDTEQGVAGGTPGREPTPLTVERLPRGADGDPEQSSQLRVVGELRPSR